MALKSVPGEQMSRGDTNDRYTLMLPARSWLFLSTVSVIVPGCGNHLGRVDVG